MLPSKIAFVDIETTGTSTRADRIIEIGIIRVEHNQVVEQFQTLVNPDSYLPPEISALTGISTELLSRAPSFSSVAKDISGLLKDCVFSAHNVRFDYGFVKQELARQDISYRARNLCTVKLSRALFPKFKRHSLDAVIKRFGFNCEHRHRAFDDAWVCWQFYEQLFTLFPQKKLEQTIMKVMQRPTVPINLSEELLDSLPECPGVYIFYGESGAPLYVGKSINIQSRVKDHFSSDHFSSKEMQLSQQVTSIETIPTTGELGALFKEAQLVKKLQPLYNRQLRLTKKLLILKTKTNEQGYLQPYLEDVDHITPTEVASVMGVFKNKKQATTFLTQIAKDQQLCEKLLGIDHSKVACFGYRLGRCKGGCVGKENPALYNSRLFIALSAAKIKQWPFSGAIAIDEKDPETNLGERHIFDQWCYLGKETYGDEGVTKDSMDDVTFDLDTYKILRRHLITLRKDSIQTFSTTL